MKKLILPILILLLSIGSYGQANNDAFNKISKTFLDNDYKSLGNQLANTLDLSIETNDGTFGKQQAIVLLKDFFSKHHIDIFKIKHKGASNEKTHYAVCDMKSKQKNWSVYILLNKESKIIQLQIED